MNSKLNPNAQAWVAALRSGEYKQGKDYLHNEDHDAFCCLGVACDLFAKSGNALLAETQLRGRTTLVTRYDESFDVCPVAVMNWLGLETNLGDMAELPTLTELNDQGKTFPEIADIIESAPKGLFVEVAE